MYLTNRKFELIGKKKFVAAVFKPQHDFFVIHITTLSINLNDKVYLLKKAQMIYLKANKACIKVFYK